MNGRFDGAGELGADDRRIVDALVDAGFEPNALENLSPADRRRARAIMSMFELLDDYPVEDAEDTLVHATIARVDREADERAARMSFSRAAEAGTGPRRLLRMPDFLSVAAVILIGASVVWPLANHVRHRALVDGCANRLRLVALGFDGYAGDNNGLMPTMQAGVFPGGWAPTRHNSVNLGLLVEQGFCDRDALTCPGHASHERSYGQSYSYQWQLPGHAAVWGGNRTNLVLGDRNPVIDAAVAGRSMQPMTVSVNHGGRGQNVLATDGVTVWLDRPVVGRRDNIWVPAGVVFLKSGDSPTDPDDVFLAH